MKRVIIMILLVYGQHAFSQDSACVRIGAQIWAQKNFDGSAFRNGSIVKEAKSKEDWLKAGYLGQPAWCYYKFNSQNAQLGKFYNYYAISDSANLAPLGWRVPTFDDYYELVSYLDPLCNRECFLYDGSLAGGSLRNDSLWIGGSCPQISSGFNVIPSGGYSPSIYYPESDWIEQGERAMLWCLNSWSTLSKYIKPSDLDKYVSDLESGKLKDKAIVIRLKSSSCLMDADDDPKLNGYSLRLIKDN